MHTDIGRLGKLYQKFSQNLRQTRQIILFFEVLVFIVVYDVHKVLTQSTPSFNNCHYVGPPTVISRTKPVDFKIEDILAVVKVCLSKYVFKIFIKTLLNTT